MFPRGRSSRDHRNRKKSIRAATCSRGTHTHRPLTRTPADQPDAEQKSEAEVLSADPAVMTGGDESATDGAIRTDDPTTEPLMEEAATNEGMAHPPEAELATEHEPEPEPAPEPTRKTYIPEETAPATPSEPRVIKETVVERKGGFFPMLIGGAAAAVIGYGFAQYQSNSWPFGPGTDDPFRSQTTATLDQQRAQLDDLTSRLGNTETVVGAFDVSDLTSAVAELGSSVTDLQGQIGDVSDQLGRLEVRVVELEKRPMEAALSPEAVAAYQREMDALRSDIESQRNEISNFAAEAVAAEQNAESQSALAQARAALAELTAALENGEPFAEQISTLQSSSDVTVPSALSEVAEEGAPTLAELVTDFPDAARAASGCGACRGGTRGRRESCAQLLPRSGRCPFGHAA